MMRGWSMLVVAGAIGLLASTADAETPAAAPQVISGRGVTYFDGKVRCPFAGLGTRGDMASNRLALDDGASRVTIDSARRRITVENSTAYPTKQVIADLTFLGTAKAENGARVPLAVHLKLEKKKAKVSVDVHPHWTTRGKLTAPEIDTWEVAYKDATTEKVVATGYDLGRVATETKIIYTLADGAIEVKDNLKGTGPSLAAGGALADLSLGFGTSFVNKMLIRAELRSLDAGNVALAGQPAAALLTKGAWQLRLTAMSSLLSQDTLRRDLFMLGLDQVPVVAAGIARGGLKKGETLAFTFRAGKGTVAWGDASGGHKEEQLAAPLDVARAFLEFNFLGALLAQEVTLASATVGAGRPTPKTR
jgi:hypothetical protein